MENEYDGIRQRLKIARKHAGFVSAAQAVQHFDLQANRYFGHENGSTAMSPAQIAQYANMYGVDFVWLILGEGLGPGAEAPDAP